MIQPRFDYARKRNTTAAEIRDDLESMNQWATTKWMRAASRLITAVVEKVLLR